MARQKTEMCTKKNKSINHGPCPGGADGLEVRISPEHGGERDVGAKQGFLEKPSLDEGWGFHKQTKGERCPGRAPAKVLSYES